MKNNSPYSAAITGCGFMINEMTAVLPLLMSDDADALLKDEIINNNLLKINTETTRRRAVAEFVRRYKAMPVSFWNDYLAMPEDEQRIAMFFVILKTYRICFDFQINVVLKNWRSVSQTVSRADLLMCIDDIAAQDAFVDSWSEKTYDKIAAAYMGILRHAGFVERDGNQIKRVSLPASSWQYYLRIGEAWFLDACLLPPYEIETIKNAAL